MDDEFGRQARTGCNKEKRESSSRRKREKIGGKEEKEDAMRLWLRFPTSLLSPYEGNKKATRAILSLLFSIGIRLLARIKL